MHFEATLRYPDMAPTRRTLLGLSVAALGGCLSEPGRSCPGATVRLSMRPNDAESPLRLDSGSLSSETVGVLETAIEDEHVEHCVSWDPGPDETGPSPGLSTLGERIEVHAGIDLSTRDDTVELDVRYEGTDYRLTLGIERSE